MLDAPCRKAMLTYLKKHLETSAADLSEEVTGVRADRMSKAHPIPAQPSTYCQAKLGNGVKGINNAASLPQAKLLTSPLGSAGK